MRINAYDKIWSTLSSNERKVVEALINSKENKTSTMFEITRFNNKSYSVYRDRLFQKGVVIALRNGYILIVLPRFGEYIRNIF